MSIDPGNFTPPFLEDENTIRARILGAIPDGMSQEPGTWVRDFAEINIAEFLRQYSTLNWMLAQCFPAWATGQQLDAHALSYGLSRGVGTQAYGSVRVFGTTGIGVPPGTIFEVPSNDPNSPRIRYQSTNVTTSFIASPPGYIDVPVLALSVGVEFNQPPGSISLLDSSITSGTQVVSQVTNPLPMIGGSDPEGDEDLRQDVLEQARLPTGSGTTIDYIVWSREVAGVGGATPYGQWDLSGVVPGVVDGRQNGSVIIALRDHHNAPVDWSVAYATQQHIDPSRELLSMFEQGEGWSTYGAALGSPPAPVPTTAATGGTVAAGVYTVAVSWVSGMGESLASSTATVTTTGTTSTITVPSPPSAVGATGWYAYVSQAGATSMTRQQAAGSPSAIGTALVITAPPTNTGSAPPASNTSAPVPITFDTTNVQAGGASLSLVFPRAGTSAIVLNRNMDLSRFQSGDDFYLWMKSSSWAYLTGARLTLFNDAGDYFYAPLTAISPNGSAPPAGGSPWWLWRVSQSQFTAVGSPSWASITSMQISLTQAAAGTVNLDYMTERYNAGSIGVGGRAPVGADVTIVSPVTVPITITVNQAVLDTGYALVDTPGMANAVTTLTANLNAYFSNLEPGQTVRRVDIHRVLHNTPGFLDWVLTAPAANVPLSAFQYAQLGALSVSLT